MGKTAKIIGASLVLVAGMSLPALSQEKPLRIIYTTHADSGNAFWLTVKTGMEDACALLSADCQMLFVAKAGDVQGQISNIQAAMAQSPDAIVTSITDNKAFDAVISDAIDNGIPVIAFNVDDSEGANGNKRLAFVGQSFFAAGYSLGRAASANFPSDGPVKVLVGYNRPEDNWSRLRGDGVVSFMEDFKAANPDRDISWDTIDAGTGYGSVSDRVGSYLTGTPDLSAYFDTGFWDVGVAQVLRDRGIGPGQVTLAGFDLVPDVMKEMKEGYIQYHVDQQPYLQGYAPVIQIDLMKKYKLSAFDINTGSAIVTPDQVDAIVELSKAGYR